MRSDARHVDLMLLDIDLPFIDGHKVLEALHDKGIQVPAIFISGLPGEEPEVKAFEIGAADFIRKPVKNTVLLARVAKGPQSRTVELATLPARHHLE
jgi:two-component system copper resistance phosphate regulon response regulator CusR